VRHRAGVHHLRCDGIAHLVRRSHGRDQSNLADKQNEDPMCLLIGPLNVINEEHRAPQPASYFCGHTNGITQQGLDAQRVPQWQVRFPLQRCIRRCQYGSVRGIAADKRVKQCGLADAGLACHDDGPTVVDA
jgi:hypothetical protein